jgi:hypothetical protein
MTFILALSFSLLAIVLQSCPEGAGLNRSPLTGDFGRELLGICHPRMAHEEDTPYMETYLGGMAT